MESVPEGGNFDGNVGVLASIEAARTLGERGIALRHPIEVAVWANEEGGLFGITTRLTMSTNRAAARHGVPALVHRRRPRVVCRAGHRHVPPPDADDW